MTERTAPPPATSAAVEADSSAMALAAFAGAIFFLAAMTPSMMPRTPLIQGFVAGVAAGVGYQIGYFLLWLWHFLELPRSPFRWRANMRIVLFAAAAVVVAYGLVRGLAWQNATREAVGLGPLEDYDPLTILLVAAIVFAVVWAIFWLLGFLLHHLRRFLGMVLPPRVSLAIGLVVVVWVTWAVVSGVLADAALRAVDGTFRVADAFVDPEMPAPTDPMQSGSAESLVNWQEMGRFGREYIATTPTPESISAFTGQPAMEPIRVYVGMRSADTARERAELALQELIRVGGFDRAVLMLVVPTGTGWMDPGSADTIDYMMGGDVATVAVQYSYLPSALALLAGAEVGVEQAREVFNVIYAYWSGLPKDARPRFYVHGLSLGAFNLQVAMPLLDLLSDPIDGAMWAGSPFFAPVWLRVRNGRKPGSPAWQPEFGNGSLVRVINQYGGGETEPAAWGPTRLVFLNYGSDPIAAFAFESAYRRPDWQDPPLAHDLAPDLRWFPLVTMLQVAVDTAFSMVVPAHGHYYIFPHYIDAWALLLDPPGWSDAQSEKLKAIFAERPLPI